MMAPLKRAQQGTYAPPLLITTVVPLFRSGLFLDTKTAPIVHGLLPIHLPIMNSYGSHFSQVQSVRLAPALPVPPLSSSRPRCRSSLRDPGVPPPSDSGASSAPVEGIPPPCCRQSGAVQGVMVPDPVVCGEHRLPVPHDDRDRPNAPLLRLASGAPVRSTMCRHTLPLLDFRHTLWCGVRSCPSC